MAPRPDRQNIRVFRMRETNRRSFGARCGGYPFWIVLDNQHPCVDVSNQMYIEK
ncbi:hypothetical protein [Aneurinibacillus migulanus]|uniref:hypothetical protein n=1 Tax=Aneurinibacillus migulanus TaxID=47500 RepID=UPI00137B736C|nr:hypothetical protein [Aneurinibacillus migulanus]